MTRITRSRGMFAPSLKVAAFIFAVAAIALVIGEPLLAAHPATSVATVPAKVISPEDAWNYDEFPAENPPPAPADVPALTLR